MSQRHTREIVWNVPPKKRDTVMVYGRDGAKGISEERSTVNRRTFLSAIGWGSISTAAVLFLLGYRPLYAARCPL